MHQKDERIMSPPAENGTCGICLVKTATGLGHAIFIAECSHSFHFSCIANHITKGNSLCTICRAKWKDLPFSAPSKPNMNPNNWNHGPVHTTPWSPFQFTPFPAPRFPSVFPPFQFTQFPGFEPEPHQYTDDEPLPPSDNTHSLVSLQKASIKVTPERPAVAASESISQFSVLVGLKAPSLSENGLDFHRAPIDLVIVLDVSGSMHGSKLDLVKRAVHFVVDNLRPSDRLSIMSFSTHASRVSRLTRMTENGREGAKRAVDSLSANGGTNIVEGLKKGVRVLEERRQKNPIASIVFLSDGNDTCTNGSLFSAFTLPSRAPNYLHLLPASIYPRNRIIAEDDPVTFPVHAFGFGSDHDPIAMHAISDASGGSFSFIESVEMVQDAFASCIGGLLSVVIQNVRLILKSASHGVEIKSIPSGRYTSEISTQGSDAIINVGDLYADEDREFLINLSVPKLQNFKDSEHDRKTSLLDITCSYKDVVSKEIVLVEADLVEIPRLTFLSPEDMVVNMNVDRQRNRLLVADSIAEAQRMAELGNLSGAQALLSDRRSVLVASQSCQAGDGLSKWLEGEINETRQRMGSRELYEKSGRAFALSGMSSHCAQRAATRGNTVAGAGTALFGAASTAFGSPKVGEFGGYATPFMAKMVEKSQQVNMAESSCNTTPVEE